MRLILGALALSSAVLMSGADAQALGCRTKSVAAGYPITDATGYSFNCCQGYGLGGSCVIEICPNIVAKRGQGTAYVSKIKQSHCIGAQVR
jgi:hypothetical protein